MAAKVDLEEICFPVFGMSSRRYRQLAKEGKAPVPVKGKIDFMGAVKGIIGYYRERAEGSGSLTLTDERTRLVKVQAELKNMELAKERGELIVKELVLDEFSKRIAYIKADLMHMDRHLNYRLEGKDFRERAGILRRYGRDLLGKYAKRRGLLK